VQQRCQVSATVCRGLGIALAVATTCASVDAPADTPPRRLVFDERYRPFQWPDAVQSGATLGAYAYLEFGVEHPTEGRWQEPILFDSAVRDALVASSRSGRDRAATISDVSWYVPMVLPWVEGIGLPLFTDRWNYEVAFQLTALNVQAVSVVALLTRAGHKLLARARPDVEPCVADPTYHGKCFGGNFASFPSGHVSAALVGAGLSCAHHAYLPLLGGGAPDATVCVIGTSLGVVSGIGRLSADRHYVTDVIAGAVLGWGAGFGMPVLLHYRWRPTTSQQTWTVTPWVSSNNLGLAALGLW
jgi:membrane-associated phospholipid phosphatase